MTLAAYKAAVVATLGWTALASCQCLCLPEDRCWPSSSQWDALNASTGGRLISTVPLGRPCHDPHYDEAACVDLRNKWNVPSTHYVSSSSVMQTYFANQSCDPFTPEPQPCELGNYASYAVNVSSNEDVIAAVRFAGENKIRLVIRNTGHDYMGRSTGAGALSIWTHHLSEIEYVEWSDIHYQGPAFKVGSGVIGAQVLEAAAARGLVVVTGECPTVGLAGGYTQGGGHSALSTAFGLAADQTLSFDVITAAGKLVTASRSENEDLYWALSGGGAGNYGVVVSAAIKAYPDTTVSGASLRILTANTTRELFTEAITHFHSLLPAMTDAGVTVIYQMSPQHFLINPLTAYGGTTSDVQAILAPFLSILSTRGIPYEVSFTEHDSYYDHYNKYMGPLPGGNLGVGIYNFGGRFISHSILESHSRTASLVGTLRNLTDHGAFVVGVGLDVSNKTGDKLPNAVFSQWRDAAVTLQIANTWNTTAPWADNIRAQLQVTGQFMPQLEAVTPGAGAYQNEADFRQPRWQETFFGSNYGILKETKSKWDPDSFFYVLKGVGSEAWSVSVSGRMCRTGS
ncbi:FAD/FMN-containing dehydrogenase [Aspergillus campestris IBT 28561]|uniref:FAD/FMN-containing dehydrogenase n=1 Tax=Aspergillus campestris (strain IBT 28561) TaxID=1392248 RepID=A0A2I1D3Y8_ASPC2|nr:FAD/FMN-containing dehydrogenase [Aspergillus campestris IBT 28561]PKY04592.1 FAD/FMN-containing dehydrogenase [Aspergillus campestris IBT 28561]